jgi:hypothetical protein
MLCAYPWLSALALWRRQRRLRSEYLRHRLVRTLVVSGRTCAAYADGAHQAIAHHDRETAGDQIEIEVARASC